MTDIQTWPLNIDFTIAVQNPHLCFADADLKQASTAKTARGRVLLWSGNFATVYKLTQGNQSWAVRCFTRIPQANVQHRYQLISEYLSQHPIPYLVNFEFLAEGVLVKGKWYPILKMDWVEGTEIDRYIGENIDDSQVLLRLDRQLKQLQKDLQRAGIAHGDLQHGNIMVDDQGELKLVDYDGMYVPALQGMPPLEIGHPNYQPPTRSLDDFGNLLDEFSFEVISLSLRALAKEPSLWETFHEDNKNLIFLHNDFQDPDSSPVFQAIANIPDDETRIICDRLILRCKGKAHSPFTKPLKTLELNIKEQLASFPPVPKILLGGLAGITILALLGLMFSINKKNPTPQPTVAQSPTPTPTIISSPTSITHISTPKPTPRLTRMTLATLLAKYAEGRRNFRHVQITGSQGDLFQDLDFRDIDLSGSVLEKIDLRQVIFKNANLNGVNIIRADLRGADLSKASLIDANFTLSNFAEANLSEANLLRANLSQSKLPNANLTKTDLMKADLSEADLNKANLSGANLLLANLRKANLTKANLRETNLSATDLSGANLEDADLRLGDLRSAELNLTNLSNANLSSANLTAARLILIELAGTNLNGANFRSAIVENIGSIEAADFSNVSNLAPNIRKYFCSLASGNVAITGNTTKSTLDCLQ